MPAQDLGNHEGCPYLSLPWICRANLALRVPVRFAPPKGGRGRGELRTWHGSCKEYLKERHLKRDSLLQGRTGEFKRIFFHPALF